jgi:carboxymethylenebutenolidase
MGEMIDFPSNGSRARGYLARPAGHGIERGILVLQEWWGLVPHIRQVADRFASEGYTALAPDLWEGKTPANRDEASRLYMALSVDKAEKQLRSAAKALHGMGGVSGKVGVVGFCMGGALALYAACCAPEEIGACIDFYGAHPHVKPEYGKLRCPVLGFFGEKDKSVSPAVAREIAQSVNQAGGEMEVVVYDAGHAFFNDSRPDAYHGEAAHDAWQRSLTFLAASL